MSSHKQVGNVIYCQYVRKFEECLQILFFIPLFSVINVYIYISITVVNIAQFDLYILRVSGHF